MSSKKLTEIFDSFKDLNVLIIGDVMVDAYLLGNVERISPEAPVPIVAVTQRENRLGGAANVALNIKSLGATPLICSVIGNDRNGDEFIGLLKAQGMFTEGILRSEERLTTVKSRIIGNNHQMLRIDEERIENLISKELKNLVEQFYKIIAEKKIDIIIFEDYDKGVIVPELIAEVVRAAHEKKIPVTADPKKKNFRNFSGITLFKPNMKELRDGMKIDLERPSISELSSLSERIRKEQEIEIVLITLSEHGIFINDGTVKKIIPALLRNIADVSGAGDTVISIASLCLAMKLPHETIAVISNIAGGQVCEKVGVVPVDKQQLLEELLGKGINH